MTALEFSAFREAMPRVKRNRAIKSCAAGCFHNVYIACPRVCLAEDRRYHLKDSS